MMLRILGSTRISKIVDILFSLDGFCVCENLYMYIHIRVLVPRQEIKAYIKSSFRVTSTLTSCHLSIHLGVVAGTKIVILLLYQFSFLYSHVLNRISYLQCSWMLRSLIRSKDKLKKNRKRFWVPETYRSWERVELSSHNQAWCSSL